MLMDKKLLYESPTTDVFPVHTEGVICGSGYGAAGAAGQGFNDGNNINDYTDDWL